MVSFGPIIVLFIYLLIICFFFYFILKVLSFMNRKNETDELLIKKIDELTRSLEELKNDEA